MIFLYSYRYYCSVPSSSINLSTRYSVEFTVDFKDNTFSLNNPSPEADVFWGLSIFSLKSIAARQDLISMPSHLKIISQNFSNQSSIDITHPKWSFLLAYFNCKLFRDSMSPVWQNSEMERKVLKTFHWYFYLLKICEASKKIWDNSFLFYKKAKIWV